MAKFTRTELIEASIDNRTDEVATLLSKEIDIDAQDKLGKSALHYAVQNYHIEIVSLLLSKGAKVDISDIHGNTPLSDAVFNSEGRGEIIRLLLEYGADRNLKNKHGVSPVDLAKTIANYSILQFLE